MERFINRTRIRTLRKQKGWSQGDLARESGIARGTVSKIETGSDSNPRMSTLVSLAAALGVRIDDLLYPPRSPTLGAMERVTKLMVAGLNTLVQNMDEDPGYNFKRGYAAKNAYFNECEMIGRPLWKRIPLFSLSNGSALEVDFLGVAELYHQTLLKCILDYEAYRNKQFNKGMAYGNLGVAQIAGGKIDHGVSSFLAADLEDQDFTNRDPHNILNGVLWQQFEVPHIFDYIRRVTKQPCTGVGLVVDQPFLESFMTSLDLQDRLLLETSTWAANDNLQRARALSTVHVRSRLLAALRNICWLIESLLRRSPMGVAYLKSQQKSQATLHPLVSNAASTAGIPYPSSYSCWPGSTKDFTTYAQAIVVSTGPSEERALACLVLTRNYTTHHSDPIPPSHDWLPLYQEVLGLVLAAIFYLRSINAL